MRARMSLPTWSVERTVEPSSLDVRFDGGMDLLGRIIKAEMLEQHGGGEDGGGRVGLVLTGDVRSGTRIGSNMDGNSSEALMQPEAE